jgi:hypothetical protein
MPPKRKATPTDKGAVCKVAKPTESAAVKPSTYEKLPVADEKTDADDWPNGLASWPNVRLTVGFVSLFELNTEDGWYEAIRLVRTSAGYGEINLDLLPVELQPSYQPDRLWQTFWTTIGDGCWKVFVAAEENRRTEQTIVEIFRMLQTMQKTNIRSAVISSFVRSALNGDIGHAVWSDWSEVDKRMRLEGIRDMTVKHTLTGHYKAVADLLYGTTTTTTVLTIDDDWNSPAANCLSLFSVSPTNACYENLNSVGGALRTAIRMDGVGLAAELLRYLAFIELDLYYQPTASDPEGHFEGPENWIVEENERKQVSVNENFRFLIPAARSYMARYRRDRAVLLRTMLADVLPYDVFGIIDCYGARPVLRSPPSE